MNLWTDERIAILKRMWSTHSATQIAAAFGDIFSRDAIIGKAHRLKLHEKRRGGDQRSAKAIEARAA